MAKILVNHEFTVSRDLFSRLTLRGLLSDKGEVTDDFLLYLQECIARDDARVVFPLAGSTASSQPSSEVQRSDEPKEKTEDHTAATKPQPSSTSMNVSSDAFASRLSKLYGGTK